MDLPSKLNKLSTHVALQATASTVLINWEGTNTSL
eukprot:COSAG05_NODE_4609_length_1440_cov_1.175242_3_plen_34_part_01